MLKGLLGKQKTAVTTFSFKNSIRARSTTIYIIITHFTDHPVNMMRTIRILSSVDLSCLMNLSGIVQ